MQKKYANLENDFDNANEQLTAANTNLEASEKRVAEVSLFFLMIFKNSFQKLLSDLHPPKRKVLSYLAFLNTQLL